MLSKNNYAFVMVSTLFTLAYMPENSSYAKERPTIDEIISGLENTEKMFFESESLLLRYERTKSDDIVQSSYSGGYLLAEWTLAYKGGKWFNERRFTQPKETKDILIPAKPKTQIVKDNYIVDW